MTSLVNRSNQEYDSMGENGYSPGDSVDCARLEGALGDARAEIDRMCADRDALAAERRELGERLKEVRARKNDLLDALQSIKLDWGTALHPSQTAIFDRFLALIRKATP